jgi:hypothetical protein
VCSSDAGCPGRKAQLARHFTVPDDANYLRGRAYLNLPAGRATDHRLDVVVMDETRRIVPKQLYTSSGWVASSGLLPRLQGEPRDYAWNISAYRGKTLRLVIRDLDEQPRCHVYAGGFQLERAAPSPSSGPASPGSDGEFPKFMLALEAKHQLPTMARYDSKRFTAVSNAGERYTRQHLRYCEVFYDLFLDHFRRRGFSVQPRPERLMVAVFGDPKGFEAYLGRRMPAGITGVYHTPSNRLVLYDLSQNAYLLASREDALRRTEHGSPHDRLRLSDTVERRYQDAAKDANLGTTMHECAHLISFNSGMLRRAGDVPVWLAEGLATYCESTSEGDWQSLGSPNPMRIDDLRRVRGAYIPLPALLKDDWLRSKHVLTGYAQSWALYRLLMEERPAHLRQYLTAIAARRAPESRLADFRQSIATDFASFEQRYQSYLNELITRYPPRRAR